MIVYIITTLLVFIFATMASYIKITNNLEINGYYSRNNRFFVLLTSLPLILVGGFRWRVGTDYWQYSINYEYYVNNFWNSLFTFEEPGLKFIAWISSIIYDDYTTMFFIASVITITLFVLTLSKYSKMFVFSILLFIFVGVWHGSFNGVKQYLACAIVFAGHRYIINKNLIKYMIVVITASMFHFSVVLMGLLYFVPRTRLNLKHIFILGLATLAIVSSYGFIFELVENFRKSSLATTPYALREVSIYRVLVAFAPLAIYFVFTKRFKLSSEELFYINLLFINAFVVLATSQSAYLARLALYTNAFTIIALPKLLNMNDKYLKFLLQMIIIILYGIFWYIDVTKSSSLVNYQWIFDKDFNF
ncbi:EpsG family protein [Bacillus weihaiensis]|uniref:EpsG family protein n=1 Tax=Bacillus weihaiensis TaxID=1547283 RepID=A0A1L3MM82_9BACI|nr:EpsG family protein [Bacillus weihaiensis]APH03459.1 hypothetical protein A9C19_01080 [Bacillus weihaiensis]